MKITKKQLFHTAYFDEVCEKLNEHFDYQLFPSHRGEEIVLYSGRTKMIEGDPYLVRLWMALHYEGLKVEELAKEKAAVRALNER